MEPSEVLEESMVKTEVMVSYQTSVHMEGLDVCINFFEDNHWCVHQCTVVLYIKTNFINMILQNEQRKACDGMTKSYEMKKENKGVNKEQGNMEVDNTLRNSVHSKEIEVRHNLYLHTQYY